MNRLQWPSRAILQPWRRSNSLSTSGTAASLSTSSDWPQLKRRRTPSSTPTITQDDDGALDEEFQKQLRAAGGSTKKEFYDNLEAGKLAGARRSPSRRVGDNDRKSGSARLRPKDSAQPSRERAPIDWTKVWTQWSTTEGHKARHQPKSKVEDPKAAADAAASKKHMLIVSGLSPNLTASDFYRLAPNSLSNWDSSIKRVQQKRNPRTLEPLGIYQVSFNSAAAAETYQANLRRLQRLSRHKLASANGLWTATVPDHLMPPEGVDVEKDVQTLTVACPSQPDVHVKPSRVFIKHPWAASLSSLLEPLGYGPFPPTVMITVSPAGLSSGGLRHFIEQDGWHHDLAWKVSDPVKVDDLSHNKETHRHPREQPDSLAELGQQQQEQRTKKKGKDKVHERFVLACETEWEARRFHRCWNQRTITHKKERVLNDQHVVSVSVIHW